VAVNNPTYKRGQMEWALWRAFTLGRSVANGPPPIFKTRIKRLLDIDRTFEAGEFHGASAADFAFGGPVVEGTGIDVAYAAVDVFCLALALDLLDVGFKQSEIVFVMRHLRKPLERWYPKIVARPSLLDRQVRLANRYPQLPAHQPAEGRAPQADARVFLILNRIEMTELLPAAGSRPVFGAPEFCEGAASLHERLHTLMPRHRRTVIVLEVAGVAQAVSAFLQKAPVVRRGRPPRHPA
jgi:hypothetical protein